MVHTLLTIAVTWVSCLAQPGTLDDVLADVSPEVAKWASVVVVTNDGASPGFEWHHYRNSAEAVNFWPASVIKVYAVVAALEYLNELDVGLDCTLVFDRNTDGRWVLDSARTMREMISEVFRRSSNEDYTLLLRFVGVDRINTSFLIPERGFPHSALMRGYVRGRPYEYVREEPQRITIHTPGGQTKVVEHQWSGTSYAEQRGATVISKTTGNCTSTREMAECLRRIMFHEQLPPRERYRLTDEQLQLIRDGVDGLTGLDNRLAGPYVWNGVKTVFPDARYFHKAGLISNYSLDLSHVDDEVSGTRFILAVAAETGKTATVTEMARRIALWIRDRRCRSAEPPPLPPTVEPKATLVEVYADDRFFEGPVWDPHTGKLYFTAFGKDNQQVLRLESPGSATVWLDGTEGINGMYLAADGGLLCAQAYGHRVLGYPIGADGPARETILATDTSWNQPNDICQAPSGDIYFTDPDFKERKTSAVYRLAPDGDVSKVIDDMAVPNGLITSNDGKTLYVADSYRKHWRAYPIHADGSVGKGRIFFEPDVPDRSDPDGMTVDADHNLYFTGRGGVWVVHADGACLGLIPVAEFCSNVTFGGADGKTLYLTCKGKVYSLAMRSRGGQFPSTE
ncbi:MAG: SMP-30/gluconolactonase/LRE family protein [Phycisphaerales bacterium]|nr:MAG: SMP-30/gluconolactonase/LRE family protein [Phycisphaerales bacterium]